MSVNLSTNKVLWGRIETLVLSLILNPVWLINQMECSSCATLNGRQSKRQSYAACHTEQAPGEPQNMPICCTLQQAV